MHRASVAPAASQHGEPQGAVRSGQPRHAGPALPGQGLCLPSQGWPVPVPWRTRLGSTNASVVHGCTQGFAGLHPALCSLQHQDGERTNRSVSTTSFLLLAANPSCPAPTGPRGLDAHPLALLSPKAALARPSPPARPRCPGAPVPLTPAAGLPQPGCCSRSLNHLSIGPFEAASGSFPAVPTSPCQPQPALGSPLGAAPHPTDQPWPHSRHPKLQSSHPWPKACSGQPSQTLQP